MFEDILSRTKRAVILCCMSLDDNKSVSVLVESFSEDLLDWRPDRVKPISGPIMMSERDMVLVQEQHQTGTSIYSRQGRGEISENVLWAPNRELVMGKCTMRNCIRPHRVLGRTGEMGLWHHGTITAIWFGDTW